MHLVVVTGFQFVVSLVVGLVVFGRGGEPRIVLRDPLLDVGQLRLDRLHDLFRFAQLLLLLLPLLVGELSGYGRLRFVAFRRRFGRSVAPLDLLQRLQLALFEEIVDAAQILLHPAVAELVDLLDHAVEEFAVVRHHDHRAVVLHNGVLEDVLRAHVHVVRRLVQHQQVARFEHHAGHRQTRPLAAREDLDLLVDVLAAEQERPQNVAQAGPDVAHGHTVQRVVDREIAVHQIVLILGVIADIDVRPEAHRPFGGRQLADQHACEGRLALAVAAHQRDPVALLDDEIRAAEDMFLAERHAGLADLRDDLPRAGRGRELDVERGEVLFLDLETVQPLQLLDARLHLVRLGGFVAEFLDELLGLLDHPLLVLVGRHLLRPPLGAQDDVFRIGDLVIGDLAQRQFDRAVGDVVQKGAVVRNEQHRAVVIPEILFEPLNRLDVEVVRRFVQQEDRGPPEQQLRQLDTHAPAARELARGAPEIRPFEPEAQQRLLDVRVAGLAAEDMIVVLRVVQTVQELFVFGAFVVGALGDLARQGLDLGLEPQHLLEGLGGLLRERRGVRHAHRLRQVSDRAVAVERHGARRGLLFARDDAQERGFARSVLAHQSDAVLRVDQQRNIVEKGPAPITDGKVV